MEPELLKCGNSTSKSEHPSAQLISYARGFHFPHSLVVVEQGFSVSVRNSESFPVLNRSLLGCVSYMYVILCELNQGWHLKVIRGSLAFKFGMRFYRSSFGCFMNTHLASCTFQDKRHVIIFAIPLWRLLYYLSSNNLTRLVNETASVMFWKISENRTFLGWVIYFSGRRGWTVVAKASQSSLLEISWSVSLSLDVCWTYNNKFVLWACDLSALWPLFTVQVETFLPV